MTMVAHNRTMTILIRSVGSFLVLTSIPLGLYVYARYGYVYGIISYLIYCTAGFLLRYMMYTDSKNFHEKKMLSSAVKASIYFVLLLFIFALLLFLIKN